MKGILLNSLLLIILGFITGCNQDDNNEESNLIDCSNLICTSEFTTITVSIRSENFDPVFLDDFKVIDVNTGLDVTPSETVFPMELILESSEYPIISDGSIALGETREMEFIGFINETEVIRSIYVAEERCCGVHLLSGDLNLEVSCETFIALPGNISNDCTTCIPTPCPKPSIDSEIDLSLRFNDFDIGDKVTIKQIVTDNSYSAPDPLEFEFSSNNFMIFDLSFLQTFNDEGLIEILFEITSSDQIISRINIVVDSVKEMAIPGQACPCGAYEISTINIDNEIIEVNSNSFILDVNTEE